MNAYYTVGHLWVGLSQESLFLQTFRAHIVLLDPQEKSMKSRGGIGFNSSQYWVGL